MTFDLSLQEARFLADHLRLHIAKVDDELVHTDARSMQHDLAQDSARLKALYDRLSTEIATQRS